MFSPFKGKHSIEVIDNSRTIQRIQREAQKELARRLADAERTLPLAYKRKRNSYLRSVAEDLKKLGPDASHP